MKYPEDLIVLTLLLLASNPYAGGELTVRKESQRVCLPRRALQQLSDTLGNVKCEATYGCWPNALSKTLNQM